MIPGDRLLCIFVDNFHVSDTFLDWPLHITIVPWFRTDRDTEELGRALSQRFGKLEPFRVVVDGEARFGRKRKTVNLIQTSSLLETLEQTSRELLREQDAWMVDETTKIRPSFRPHITVQKAGRVHAGDTIAVDSVYIVEQKGDHKEIVSRIHL